MEIIENLDIQWQNVLLVWLWWLQNFWDELILLGNIKLLQKQNKNIFIVSQNNNRLKKFLEKEVDCSNIVFIDELPRWFRSFLRYIKNWDLKQLKYFFKIDSIILWGWEILTEETKISYYYWLCSIWPSIFFRKKLYIMWWVQIPKKRINKILFNLILRHTSHIYCRDFDWINNLKEYGFSEASFFMDTSFFVRENWKKYKGDQPNKCVVININKNWVKFMDDLKQSMKEYVNKWYKYFFIPISNGWNDTQDANILKERMIPDHLKNTENDLKYLWELKKEFPEIEIFDWTDSLENFFYFIWSAEMVICTRLHLFLISSFIWVNTKVYPYQKKILKMQTIIEKKGIN